MSRPHVSGIEPGQRQLNGPQTSGRQYRNLSSPEHTIAHHRDVPVLMRDGTTLLVDVHAPAEPGQYPVLVAASPYPRQMQDLGAPAGFIEAGSSDFFVPRGYVHVIANCRGTSGSGGEFGFFDAQERRDMYDLVEWAGVQAWSNGNVGMIGISYFACTQMEAAVGQPPHLKAIMPIAGTWDLYGSATHHGLVSSGFITPFLAMIGLTSARSPKFWRSKVFDGIRDILLSPKIHKRFERANGEAAIAGLKTLVKLHHDPHPWDDLWRAIVAEHPLRDAWWEDRNLLPLLDRVTVPVYLGCDWQNVPLHLPHTFTAWSRLVNSPHVRVAMLGEHGLSWPWESLHIEALAWFDHWLKGRDTGILEGPKFRYLVPESEGWRASEQWPLAEARYRELGLGSDGRLGASQPAGGTRDYLNLGAGLFRQRTSAADPPFFLAWDTEPLPQDLEFVGPIELQLDAKITAPDTAFIVVLQDVAPDGAVTDVTGGYLRAGLRAVDPQRSAPGAPVLPCDRFEAVPIGELVQYRIPLVPNARRLKQGHRLRVYLTSDDQDASKPALLMFRHGSIGTSSVNSVLSTSRLLLPVVGGG